MSELPILDHIKALAEREIARLTDDAAAEAARITGDAAKTAQEMTLKATQQVESEADRIRERQTNTLRFAHNAARYELKSRALSDLWREAEASIAEVENSNRYPAILEALFRESAKAAPAGAAIHTAPDDAELVRKLAENSGKSFTVVPDDSISGGVAFHWPQGGTVLINTLGRRLARLKSEGNADISRLLFAGSEEQNR